MEDKVEIKPAKVVMGELLGKHYEDAYKAKENGEKVGWAASNFPSEIAEAMDIKLLYPENHAAAVAAKKGSLNMCEYSESMGYSNDLCAYARINLAYMDIKHCEELNMPMPDFVLCCNNICNQMIKWYENLAYELKIPMIMVDIPYNYEDDERPELIEYIRDQIDYAIKELEKITGKKMDKNRLDKVMKISCEARKAWSKVCSYTQYVPSPINGFELFNHMALMVCAKGSQSTVDAMKLMADEYEEKVQNGESTYKGEQKYRILFEGIACWPFLKQTLIPLYEHNMNMVGTVYAAAFGNLFETQDEFIKAYCSVPNAISFKRAVKLRTEVIEATKCDAAIIHNNRSCKCWGGFLYSLEKALIEETGIATVMFDGDQADSRNFSEAQYATRIQGLYEVLKSRKQEVR